MDEAAEFLMGGGCFGIGGDTSNNNNGGSIANHFTVDDLLDFSKEEEEEDEVMTDAFFDKLTTTGDSSAVTAVDSCNSSSVSGGDAHFNGNVSSRSFTDAQFSGSELCVPYDDLAELEWLSNFVEDSFSSDDLHNLQLIPTPAKPPATTTDSSSSTATTVITANNSLPHILPSDVTVPGKARSKRSRAAPCDWSSRLLLLSPATSSSETTTTTTTNNYNHSNSTSNITITIKAPKATPSKKREPTDTPGRKCLHCASEKTPQWRTGPMGPKTLCNACGVRYKSGRLVPEYRPAASPTFVSAKHSNSHRKVLELRRQKEMQRQQQQHQQHHLLSQTSIFGVGNGPDDFLIHQPRHHHPEFRHMNMI